MLKRTVKESGGQPRLFPLFLPKRRGRGREERPLTPEGIVKEYAEKFYKSRAWKHTRQAYLEKVGGLCERCHERQGYIVHHRIRLTPEIINDDTVALSHANLMYECKQCHELEPGHGVAQKLTARVLFDENGDAIGAK